MFNLLSLNHWLQLCQEHRIPYVPAYPLIEFDKQRLLEYGTDGLPPDDVNAFYEVLYNNKRGEHLLRWDHCASGTLKKGILSGNSTPYLSSRYNDLTVRDPRVKEALELYPGDLISVWKRPWIKTLRKSLWPVEFRSFVRDGKVQGISNRYPRVDITSVKGIQQAARKVMFGTIKLAKAFPQERFWHEHIGIENSVSFSTDWLVRSDGRVLFLDGGLPWTETSGVDPCCFRGSTIEGVQLHASKTA